MASYEFLSQDHIKHCIKELQGQPSLRSSEVRIKNNYLSLCSPFFTISSILKEKVSSRAAVLVPICQTM
jgi:hypothetical protein